MPIAHATPLMPLFKGTQANPSLLGKSVPATKRVKTIVSSRNFLRMRVKVMKVDGDDDFESTSGMVDTCHGDSGGPLACQVPHQNQGHRYVFIAICIAIMIITFITNIPNFFYRQGTGRTSLWGLSTGAVDTVERSLHFFCLLLPIFSTNF